MINLVNAQTLEAAIGLFEAQGMHHGQLSRVVEFEPGNAFTTGKHCGLRQVMQLTSVDKAFQDVLLDAKVIVANAREPVSELWEVFHGLF